MTTALRPVRVRFDCNVDSHAAVVDQMTNQAAITWRGVPVNVEFLLRVGSTIVDSAGDISKLYFQVHTNRSLGALWVKELDVSALTLTVTEQQWAAKTHEHGTFELDAADMQIDMTGVTDGRRVLYWVLHVVLNDGTPITVGTGQWIVEEDGAGNQLPITPGSNWNIRQSPTSGLAQLQSPRTGLWHSIMLSDASDGEPRQLVINQTGEA